MRKRRILCFLVSLLLVLPFSVSAELFEEELDIEDIIKMDWLCSNVVGKIPSKEELRERARPIVELKGVKQEENEDTVTG